MKNKLIIALPKGRMQNTAYRTFANAAENFRSKEYENEAAAGRKLKYESEDATYILPKAGDVPLFVDTGSADMGICGFDCMREYELENMTGNGAVAGRMIETQNLNGRDFPVTRFCCIGEKDNMWKYYELLQSGTPIVIATKYPEIAKKFFAGKYPNATVDIAQMSGSCEIAIKFLNADVVFDLVETGRTLNENGLVIYERACENPPQLLLSKCAIRKDSRILKIANMTNLFLGCWQPSKILINEERIWREAVADINFDKTCVGEIPYTDAMKALDMRG